MDLAHGNMGHTHPYTGMEYEYIVLGFAYHQHGNMHDHSLAYTFLFLMNVISDTTAQYFIVEWRGAHTHTHIHRKSNKKKKYIRKNVQGHGVI